MSKSITFSSLLVFPTKIYFSFIEHNDKIAPPTLIELISLVDIKSNIITLPSLSPPIKYILLLFLNKLTI